MSKTIDEQEEKKDFGLPLLKKAIEEKKKSFSGSEYGRFASLELKRR